MEMEQLNSTPHTTPGSPNRSNPPSEQAAEQIDPIPEEDRPDLHSAACIVVM